MTDAGRMSVDLRGDDVALSDVLCSLLSTVAGVLVAGLGVYLWARDLVSVTLVPSLSFHFPEGFVFWALGALGCGVGLAHLVTFGVRALWRQRARTAA